jgi:hypothetical protein
MTSELMQVSDDEVERLAKKHGPRSIAAEVLAELRTTLEGPTSLRVSLWSLLDHRAGA